MYAQGMVMLMVVCLVLAGYISQQAMAVEQKLVTAVKIALAISASGDARNPQWDNFKNNMLASIRAHAQTGVAQPPRPRI